MARLNKLNLKLDLQPKDRPKYSVSDSGTFKEEDLQIGKHGLLIHGESPRTPLRQGGPEMSALRRLPSDDHSSGRKKSKLLTKNDLLGESLSMSQFRYMNSLGSGSSGMVKKALHLPTQKLLAIKMIQLDLKEKERKTLLLELKALHKAQCNYVVTFFDAFFDGGVIHIALEYMNAGSIQSLLQKCGSIPDQPLRSICIQVLKGLCYLHKELHMIHRDIKPSNILLNKRGEVKLADFGVSSHLQHTVSKANTFVGTVTYMSPERLKGEPYSYDSDIWSFGLTVFESIIGKFPYDTSSIQNNNNSPTNTTTTQPPNLRQTNNTNTNTNANNNEEMNGDSSVLFWQLLDLIAKKPPPTLNAQKYGNMLSDFVSKCLQRDPKERFPASSLLEHPWIGFVKAEEENETQEQHDKFVSWLSQYTGSSFQLTHEEKKTNVSNSTHNNNNNLGGEEERDDFVAPLR